MYEVKVGGTGETVVDGLLFPSRMTVESEPGQVYLLCLAARSMVFVPRVDGSAW